MIRRRTKIQLLVFLLITLLGVSYVGARYAQLDRLFYDDSYTVVAHFSSSGGIFSAAQVTYRGVRVGRVGQLKLTKEGVDVYLDIDKAQDRIPADTLAVVGNRSAVGQQYVELQPQTDSGPYLSDDSEIAVEDTRTPIQTETLLGDLATTASSVDKGALRTTVSELGAAFGGTGRDLQRIIDTGNSFIKTANQNFGVTTRLIRDSNTVLRGQLASESSIRTFASQLRLFSGTLADADPALRTVITEGSATARQLRTFLEQNRIELGDLINNLVTTGEITVRHLPGTEQILVLYPYVVEGGFTVVSKSPETGLYDAHFGLITTPHNLCRKGYESTDRRTPYQTGNRPMNTKARCEEPAALSSARGAQHSPGGAGAVNRAPVAAYDPVTGRVQWGSQVDPESAPADTVAPPTLGEETWKWLFLQPMTAGAKDRATR